MAYPQMHGWEHCIRDTSQAKRRVFGKNRNSWDVDARQYTGWIGSYPWLTWVLSWGRTIR